VGCRAGRVIVQLSHGREPCLFSRCSTLPAVAARRRPWIAPRNKGQSYPADPPTVDEIVAVMRQAGHDRDGHRLNALIVGHSHLSTTGTYLEGINNEEIISTVHARRPPMMHASAGLAL
jgi:hypothetical protein